MNVIATILENNQRQYFSLGLIKLNGTDGVSLAKAIKGRISEFKISSKFITTDGARNMWSMARNANLFQQLCLIHGLQLVVSETIFSKKDKFGMPVLELPEEKAKPGKYNIFINTLSINF